MMNTYAPFLGQVHLAQALPPMPDTTQMLQNMQQNTQGLQQQMNAQGNQNMQQGINQLQQTQDQLWDAGGKYVGAVIVGGLVLTGLLGWGVYKIIHG